MMRKQATAVPRPPRRRGGYMLIEVVIAILLASVIITAVMGAALTAQTDQGKNDRRLMASVGARNLTGRLRNFVTGCDCDIATGICSPASCTINGPTPTGGVPRDPRTWALTDLNTSPRIVDCYYANAGALPVPISTGCGGSENDRYALQVGFHVVSGLLPADFEAAPYNARVVYQVTNSATYSGRPVPRVDVDVQWTEP